METTTQTTASREARPSVSFRRDHDRLDIELQLTAEADHKFFTGFTQNISAGGLFIATHAFLPIGDMFVLTFCLPGADTLFCLTCEVRWVRQADMGPGLPAGMGVRFLDVTPQQEALIDDYIATQETLFYDDEDL
ncbi:MAG: hypothetical protein AMXMBFR64_61540 [Myxococcales bacterium]